MDQTHGFYGRWLDVDLTARRCQARPLDAQTLRATLGGKGLAARLLLQENPPGCDPLGPDNRLVFAAGPAARSLVWGSSRYGVFTRSPLTGGWCESYSGGRVPEAVDAAGYDAVVVHGRSDEPLLLVVHPEGCEFLDASQMAGMETYAAEDAANQAVAELFPDFRKRGAAVVGPAGERGVPFACIENDYWRSAGRGGAGAVMGAKGLKAVAFAGDRQRVPAHPEAVAAQAKALLAEGRDHPGVKAYKARGTTQMVAVLNTVQAFPARYWRQGTCDHWEAIGGDRMHEEQQVTPHACLKCFMACGRMTTVRTGRHAGLTIEGPEYETIYAFGGLCMIEDLGEIAWMNDLCDRLGMDTITAGNLVGLAMEATALGRLRGYDPVPYGDADAAALLLRQMAAGEGLGGVLARGIAPAAAELGLEDLAVHVKGMEPAGYDPRVLKGMGLSYATSPRGACHLRTTFYKPELAGMIAPDAVEGKAALLADFEDRLTVFDTLVLCRFFRDLYPWEALEEMVAALTGLDASKAALRRIAARVSDDVRRFNLREGVGPEQDRLPDRLLREALPTGHALDADEMDAMLADYYRERGWNDAGIPPERG